MRPLMVTFALSLLVTAQKPREEPVTDDRDRLQGSWTVVSFERDGSPLPADEVKQLHVIIAADRLTIKHDRKAREAVFNLDATRRPREINIIHPDSPQKDYPWPGIYELEGDTLKLCYPFQADRPRPKEFKAPAGSGLLLLVLKRERP